MVCCDSPPVYSKENLKLRAAAGVGDVMSEALGSAEESELTRADALQPTPSNASVDLACCCPCVFNDGKKLLNRSEIPLFTRVWPTVADALDDSGTAKHAGFEEKELRRRRRELRLAEASQGS